MVKGEKKYSICNAQDSMINTPTVASLSIDNQDGREKIFNMQRSMFK